MPRAAGLILMISLSAQLRAQPAADLLQQAEEKVRTQQFASAERLLEQVLIRDRSNSDALFRLAYVRFRMRKLTPARIGFAVVVKLAPPAYNSRYFLGRICLLENKPKEAIRWLEPVVASGETAYDAASQLARAYVASGDSRKALQALHTAISQAPWDSALYYRLGRIHQQLGEEELARESLQTSARLKSASREDVETLMRASELMTSGRQTEALELGRRILDRKDADPDSLVALGIIYVNAKVPDEALRAFERAAALDAKQFQAQFDYGLALLKAGRAQDALHPLIRAFELLPQSEEAAVTLGLAAVMNQQYAQAVAPLELGWKRNSKNARLGALLATAYLRTGAARKAVPVLRAVSALGNSDPAPLLLLVEALEGSGDNEEALKTALLVETRFPRIPESHMAAAQQLVKSGKYDEARRAFEEVLKLRPDLPEAELGLADSLQKSGRHADSLAHYRSAGGSLPARLGEARSLVALRQPEEAREVLEKALAEFPSDVSLRLELSRVYARLGQSGLAAEQARIIEQLRAR